MRILAVSVAPLFPDRIMGGSQRILMEVVDALAEDGHQVRVLCSDSGARFRTRSGASVEPMLELRGSFPAPFQTAPHRLNSVWEALEDGSNWADRAYLHADAIYMRAALGDLPIIRSLHDFVYEESLLSAFTLSADRTIVPSQYIHDCIKASAGLVTGIGELVVIPNGVGSPEWPVKPMLPADVAARRPGDLILLHPHRLHREKGIEESMRIAAEVQKQLPDRRIRLLVPALQPGESADDANLARTSIQELATSAGADELLELHTWLPPDQMPNYFAAGDVTLCPGSFVEAFGLTPLESVVAGTPAVCAKVGAFREQIGLQGISHFDPADIPTTAKAVVRAVSDNVDARDAAGEIAKRYDLREMKNAYVKAITGTLPTRNRLRQKPQPTGQQTSWKLAPWCYVSGQQIYHDYLARFERFPELANLLDAIATAPIEVEPGNENQVSELERAKMLGFVTPA